MNRIVIILFLFFYDLAFAQTEYNGQTVDKNNLPIPGVSIVITPIYSKNVLAFAISDSNGKYSITLTREDDKLMISARLIGFVSVSKKIENKSQVLDFQLKQQAIQLKDVVAKASPIRQRGDTIDYSVNTFAKEHDRSIADVLSRMPGIEVRNDGKILYEGKAINKYYIDGLDMLEGRYNLANKNLPHQKVTSVQVLENHQPIKILDSLVYSENAAINIKLKNKYTVTGQVELGSGASPLLWETNVTPMLFTRNKQMLSTYQANNTGNNVGTQLKTLSIQSVLEGLNSMEKQDWLGIHPLALPNFKESRWLDNNIHVFSTNFLQKLSNDYEVKLNFSYLNDYQQLQGSTKTRFYTTNDTIYLNERKYNQLYFNSLESKLILEKNTKKNFFKNTIEFQGFWEGQRGRISTDEQEVLQDLNNHYFKLSNTMRNIFPLGKQLMTLNSYVGIDKTPQNLRISPGQFSNLLHQGENYDLTLQNIAHKQFYTINSLGFNKGLKAFSFSPKVGFEITNQQLNSSIYVDDRKLNENQFNNELDWSQTKIFAHLSTQYKKKDWRLTLNTPINYYAYKIQDELNQQGQDINKMAFEPSLNITYEPTAFWKFHAGSNFREIWGGIHDLHYAYLLKNYRNIQIINAHLPQRKSTSFSTGFNYKNPIKALFLNAAYSHSNIENNLLYQTQLQTNGATEITAIEQKNKNLNHQFSTRISKYLGRIGTNLTLQANLGFNASEQIINDILINVKNQNSRIGTKIDKDFSDILNVELNANWSFFKNRLPNQENRVVTRQEHLLNFNIYPNENQYIGLKTEWSRNNIFRENRDYFFADIVYRYTWKKMNMDLELQWNNIFNTTDYSILMLDAYSFVETNFKLRPSQVLLKVRFSL